MRHGYKYFLKWPPNTRRDAETLGIASYGKSRAAFRIFMFFFPFAFSYVFGFCGGEGKGKRKGRGGEGYEVKCIRLLIFWRG